MPPGFPEVRQRLEGVLGGLTAAGLDVVEVEGTESEAARAAVGALHDAGYIERFRRAVERGDGLLDSADNPLSPGTWDAAWGAVTSAVEASDWVQDVAQHLVSVRGMERVAVFDFDVHHGNGTQHLFYDRGDVLYASIHQWPFYPGTGAVTERGEGAGSGATVNAPLPAGCGDDRYAEVLETIVLPALESFAPQALVVSAGFDAWHNDPLGGMRVTREGYESWGRMLGELAARQLDGRVVSVLEGGYDIEALPDLVVAYVSAFDAAAAG
jgi:acetoin utilization deacetylase AcuC-like enzyme